MLHEDATEPLAGRRAVGPVLLVVGPEGGLAPEELAAFADAGARTVRLGAEVLRTSTAGVAAVSALLSRTPRWRPGSNLRRSTGKQLLHPGDLVVELGLLPLGEGPDC